MNDKRLSSAWTEPACSFLCEEMGVGSPEAALHRLSQESEGWLHLVQTMAAFTASVYREWLQEESQTLMDIYREQILVGATEEKIDLHPEVPDSHPMKPYLR